MAVRETRVALITGASSGIGLALTKHLISKSSAQWFIVMLDLNPPPSSADLPADRVKYMRCNVADWDTQATCFREAFSWKGRLDFAALNAGIDDRDDIFNSIDHSLTLEAGPRKPNMATFDVNLIGVYYGIKLCAHYFSASEPEVKSSNEEKGNIVLTSSAAGLYPGFGIPQYSATKEALLSLTRSLSRTAQPTAIRINALCPQMVPTGLSPPGLMEIVPEDCVTPMSTILRAFDEMMDPISAKTGGIVEASIGDLYWRQNDGWKPVGPGKWSESEALKVWNDTYRVRNRKFAMTDWEKEKASSKS